MNGTGHSHFLADATAPRPPVDGATLAVVYVFALLVVPARLIFSGVPLTLPPSLAIALGLGIVWFAAQFLSTVSIGKGHNLVRAMLGVYLATHLLTYAVATRRGLPGDELRVADSSLIRIVGTIALAVFICDGIGTRDRLDRLLKVFVASAVVVAGVGLVQFATGIDLAAYVSIPGLSSQSVYSAIEERSVFRRPSGTTSHPIEFGIVCSTALPLAVHYALKAARHGAPRRRWWVYVVLLAAGGTLALSRTALITMAVGGLVLLAAVPDPRKYRLAVVAPVFFVGACATVPGLLGTLYGMFSFFTTDSSVTSRTKDYPHAFELIAQNPLLGRGFGTFISYKYTILDNQYLLTMVEDGYIGLAALILILLAAIITTLRVRFRAPDVDARSLAAALTAAVAGCGIGAATFDILNFSVATGTLFLLVGSAGALLRTVRHEASAYGPVRAASLGGTAVS